MVCRQICLALCLNTDNCSTVMFQMHAELKYNEEFKRYVVIDHASQNGTFVNGDRVCEVCVKYNQG
jgi:hypothetical protein